MMSRLRTIFVTVHALGLVLWCWPQTVAASESPLEMIRATTRQALTVLENPAYRGSAQRGERLQQMWDIILPHFDEQEIARRSLGPPWRELTAEQHERFTALFLQLVKHSYSSTLDRFSTDAQFFFDSERIEGQFAEVATRILAPGQSAPFVVLYRVHQRDGRWLVYDVVAENISMVRNYRAQFQRILARSSFDGLVQTLEDRLKELGTS